MVGRGVPTARFTSHASPICPIRRTVRGSALCSPPSTQDHQLSTLPPPERSEVPILFIGIPTPFLAQKFSKEFVDEFLRPEGATRV